jgi:hypothetical protein
VSQNQRDRQALAAVGCPLCQASAGNPCIRVNATTPPRRSHALIYLHRERVAAFTAATEADQNQSEG